MECPKCEKYIDGSCSGEACRDFVREPQTPGNPLHGMVRSAILDNETVDLIEIAESVVDSYREKDLPGWEIELMAKRVEAVKKKHF